MKKVTVEISRTLDKRVRVIAAQLDMNRSEFIRQALEQKLAQLINAEESGFSHLVAGPITEISGVNVTSQANDTVITGGDADATRKGTGQ